MKALRKKGAQWICLVAGSRWVMGRLSARLFLPLCSGNNILLQWEEPGLCHCDKNSWPHALFLDLSQLTNLRPFLWEGPVPLGMTLQWSDVCTPGLHLNPSAEGNVATYQGGHQDGDIPWPSWSHSILLSVDANPADPKPHRPAPRVRGCVEFGWRWAHSGCSGAAGPSCGYATSFWVLSWSRHL